MTTLTTSQLVQALIEKGHHAHSAIRIAANKWGADYITIVEWSDGKSYINLFKKTGEDSATRVASYSKMKAADKKELASLILA